MLPILNEEIAISIPRILIPVMCGALLPFMLALVNNRKCVYANPGCYPS